MTIKKILYRFLNFFSLQKKALPFVKSLDNSGYNYSHYLKVAINNESTENEECILIRLFLDSTSYKPNVAVLANRTRSDPIELFF